MSVLARARPNRRQRASALFFWLTLAAFLSAGLADMLTFALIPPAVVPFTESNPLARIGGLPGLILPKVVLFGAAGIGLTMLYKCGIPRAACSLVLLLMAVLGVLAAWTNVAWGWT